jgi:hypothetical protein
MGVLTGMPDSIAISSIEIILKSIIISTGKIENNDIRKASDACFIVAMQQTESGIKIPESQMNPGDTFEKLTKFNLEQSINSYNHYLIKTKPYNEIDKINKYQKIIVPVITLVNDLFSNNLENSTILCKVCGIVRDKSTHEIEDINLSDFNDKNNISLNISAIDKQLIINSLNIISESCKTGDIAFELLPELFTINDLENVYTLIFGYSVPSFRRIILPKLIETELTQQNRGYRPSKLFKAKERIKRCLDVER